MELIYENPEKTFTIREMEKLTNLPKATISDYLKEMQQRKLLDKDSLFFKTKKANYFIEKMIYSGLIGLLINKLHPSCIIIFGSIRKGEYNKDSDIDIFIESAEKKEIDLTEYNQKLKHNIQLFLENDINNLPSNLFNNVINGIKIYGGFKIR